MPRTPSDTEPPAENTAAAPDATTPLTPPTAETGTGDRFFSWLRGIGIRREPGWMGGVCAGIAARLGIDPLIVRGIAVVVAILGAPAILIYAVGWLLLPDMNDKIHLEEVFRGKLEAPVAAIAALLVLAFLPLSRGIWFANGGFWTEGYWSPDWNDSIGGTIWSLLLIGALVWFVIWLVRRSKNTPSVPPTTSPLSPETSAAFVASTDTVAPPVDATEPEMAAWREQQATVRAEQDAFRNQQASDRAAAAQAAAAEAQRLRSIQREKDRVELAASRSHPLYSLIVIGLALVAGGLATMLYSGGALTTLAAVVGLATTLAVLAVGIIINGVRGKRSGGAAGVAAIVFFPLLFTAALATGTESLVRLGPNSTLTPTSSQEFHVAGGRVTLDLTEMPSTNRGDPYVELFMGAGDVTVVVPDDAIVNFSATVGAGSINAGDNEESTRVGPVESSSAVFTPDDAAVKGPQLTVRVQLGAGVIRVVEAGDNE